MQVVLSAILCLARNKYENNKYVPNCSLNENKFSTKSLFMTNLARPNVVPPCHVHACFGMCDMATDTKQCNLLRLLLFRVSFYTITKYYL